MDAARTFAMVAVIAGMTALTRFLPFLLFPPGRKTPPAVLFLSRALPSAVIGMLVVYCLKDLRLTAPPHGLPELLSVGAVVLIHLKKRSTLLSVAAGTACYMVLVQLVFRP